MPIIQPGQPLNGKFNHQEESRYSISRSGHCLLVVQDGLTAEKIAHFAGTVQLALYADGPVLFLLYKFNGNEWQDAPFSWHTGCDGEKVYLDEKVISPFEYSFRLVLAEASCGTVMTVREITLEEGFVKKLRDIILKQSRSMFNAHSFVKHLNTVYNKTDISVMVDQAEAHFKSN